MGLLLPEVQLADLSVGNYTDNSTVFLNPLDLLIEDLCLIGNESLLILGEGLSLGFVPVLVEAAQTLIRQMLSPDSGERTQAMRGLDVTNNANNNHGWSLQDGYSLDDFSLVHL